MHMPLLLGSAYAVGVFQQRFVDTLQLLSAKHGQPSAEVP
jgi:hypothetical protein